jgi:putative FmdB family regulatory protein
MPIFEYICKDCKHSFEKLVMGSAKPECPSCHGKQLAQKFSVFSASVSSPRIAKSGRNVGHPTMESGRNVGHPTMGGCCGGGACGRPGPCDN